MKVIITPIQTYTAQDHFLSDRLIRKKPVVRFWTKKELNTLKKMHNSKATAVQIGTVLGRTASAVNQKIQRIYRDYLISDFTLKQKNDQAKSTAKRGSKIHNG